MRRNPAYHKPIETNYHKPIAKINELQYNERVKKHANLVQACANKSQ